MSATIMKVRATALLSSLLAGCGGAAKPAPSAPQPAASASAAACVPYLVTFAPGAGHRYTHTSLRQRQRTIGSSPPVDETISLTEEVELRAAGQGYVMTTRPGKAKLWRSDGGRVGAIAYVPFESALTYELDAEGRALSIRGFEDVIERVMKMAINDEERQAAPSVTPAVLEAARISEWQGMVADWHGVEGCIGEVINGESELPLPTGAVKFTSATRVAGYVDCPLGRCLELDERYDSDAGAMESWLSGSVLKPMAAAVSKSQLSGSVKTVLDPQTLRLVSIRGQRTLGLSVEVAGQALPAKLVESQQHDFEYH